MQVFCSFFKTALGWSAVFFDDNDRVTRLILPSSRRYVDSQTRRFPVKTFRKLEKKICAYFEGKRVDFNGFNLSLDGCPPFHKKVYTRLRRLPYGRTATYGDLAEFLENRFASRAVGQAMAKNSVPLIVPCHRVVCANGKIGNFSAEGGAQLKRKMLEMEGAVLPA